MDALSVPGHLDSLDTIRDYVKTAAEAAGLDRRAAYRLILAVDEVATNIITHGYEEAGRQGDILVSAELEPERLRVTLEDSAVPYDPMKTESPDNLEDPLETRDIGGLGVFLVLQGVDSFSYEYLDGHNRNIFAMNRLAEGSPS